MKTLALLVSLIALVACGGGGSDVGPDAGARPDAGEVAAATTVYDPPEPGAGAAWGAVPFPSDLYLDGAGKLALTSVPAGTDARPEAIDMLVESLAAMDGAGVWSNVYFPVQGEVDPGSLEGAVHLIDLDNGGEVPVDAVWRADLHAIVIVPRLGHTLRDGTRYGAYVTDDVLAADGQTLAAAQDFTRVVGKSEPTEQPLKAARDSLAPLLALLDEDVVGSLVAATVFRTHDAAKLAVSMREVILAGAPPVATVDPADVHGPSPAELEALFGVTSDDAVPGFPHAGYRPQPKGNIAYVVHGTLPLPNFLSDTPGEAGFPTVGGDGKPVIKGTDPVRFTVTLPRGSLENVPVVVYVAGLNRTRLDMMVQADTAAASGMAMIGIDLNYHGDRSPQARDARNDLTGASTPDGFGDLEGLQPATRFFHLVSLGDVPAYHPGAMRENLRQAALDIVSLVDFVTRGDAGPIATAIGEDLSFRTDTVGLLAESFGALVSGVTLAIEPRIDAAVFSSPAAGFPFPSMVHSPHFSDLFLGVITNPFAIGERVVLGDPAMGGRMEPLFMLYNAIMEPGEASAYARHILPGTYRGGEAPSLLILEAWADEWVSNEATESYAALVGVPRMVMTAPEAPPESPLRYVELEDRAAPLAGNAGGRTAALTLWYPSAHAALRKVDDVLEFEPGYPPFVPRTEPQVLDTLPIEAIHAQWSRLMVDLFAGATPTIIDPYAD